MSPLRESTLSVIGAGVMAEAIIAGVLERKLVPAASIIASHPRADRRSALSEKHGIQVTADNVDAARRGDVVVLGIKPQVMPGVLSELRGSLAPGKLVIYHRRGHDPDPSPWPRPWRAGPRDAEHPGP